MNRESKEKIKSQKQKLDEIMSLRDFLHEKVEKAKAESEKWTREANVYKTQAESLKSRLNNSNEVKQYCIYFNLQYDASIIVFLTNCSDRFLKIKGL